MPLHQHVWSGKTMHRDGLRFEDARDLAEDHCMVADMLHHLITEAKLKMTVREGDAIIRFVHALQSFLNALPGRSSCPNNRRNATNRRCQPRERHSPCSIIF